MHFLSLPVTQPAAKSPGTRYYLPRSWKPWSFGRVECAFYILQLALRKLCQKMHVCQRIIFLLTKWPSLEFVQLLYRSVSLSCFAAEQIKGHEDVGHLLRAPNEEGRCWASPKGIQWRKVLGMSQVYSMALQSQLLLGWTGKIYQNFHGKKLHV